MTREEYVIQHRPTGKYVDEDTFKLTRSIKKAFRLQRLNIAQSICAVWNESAKPGEG